MIQRAVKIGLLALCLASAACSRAQKAPQPSAASVSPPRAANGACAECHPQQVTAWSRSHHAQSMQPATPEHVLADFEHAQPQGLARAGDQFLVAASPVQYTFGVYPLQQYLVATQAGRLQVFGLAWDARPAAGGGQRWFDPAAAAHGGGGVPNWHGRDQNWNSMCASCHSTALRKGYDAEHDSFDSRWTELNVSCEACHGSAAGHLEWARTGGGGDARGFEHKLLGATSRPFRFSPGQAIAHAAASGATISDRSAEINRCVACHARRQELTPAPQPAGNVLDDYLPSLVDRGLYYPDGQLDDENFEYASFAQSRMYQAGVTCSHCHDPHTGQRKAPGNQLCAQCHAPDHYDQPAHHHHQPQSSGAQCVGCHMPSRVFMGIHVRRDHAIRVPRPQLSAALGTPDACQQCHADRSRAWPGSIGEGADGRFARARAAADGGEIRANELLAEVASDDNHAPIRRATALSLLRGALSPRAHASLEQAVHADDDLLRLGAARALDALTVPERAQLGAALLHDRTRAVRTEAARALIDLPRNLVADQPQLEAAFREWREARASTAERPEAHLDLAQVFGRLGQADAAERELHQALALDRTNLAARINLADLQRATGRDAEAETLLRETVALQPKAAVAWHALGLTLVRLQRRKEALEPLARAAQLEPQERDYVYAYRLALREASPGN